MVVYIFYLGAGDRCGRADWFRRSIGQLVVVYRPVREMKKYKRPALGSIVAYLAGQKRGR